MIIVGIALLVLFVAVCVAIIKQSAFEQGRKRARQQGEGNPWSL